MAPLIPTLAAHARTLLTSTLSKREETLSEIGPLAARSLLTARDVSASSTNADEDPTKGVLRPGDINNTFVFVLFGLIGAGLICLMIWFFFWAKNGGFYFKENDWDDYKTTVMRRRGPNGTILSGATPSTQLGGGSVYKDIDEGTEYTGGLTQMTGDTAETGSTLTGITGGVSDFAGRERRRHKRERKERERKEREREKKKDRKNREKSGRHVGEDGALVDEEAEAEAKSHLRAYRHEKPARVGGINKTSEGSEWDGSTNPENSTADSELLSHRQSTPTRDTPEKKTRKGGIRKVYSTADRTENRENERIRAEARRLTEKGRAAGGARRDFSYQRAESSFSRPSPQHAHSTIEEETGSVVGGDGRGRYLPPGSYMDDDIGSEVGTKSYHHPIPGLSASSQSGAGSDYAEERRKKRGAGRYRRD
ncbi:hypothetical protein F5Y15DRAFT_213095 [Xylariaceae sp. FL0016]|nr:hypothetical protein F5Y15DRAFT_213095 [Xylariaceae sp. FL0016]